MKTRPTTRIKARLGVEINVLGSGESMSRSDESMNKLSESMSGSGESMSRLDESMNESGEPIN